MMTEWKITPNSRMRKAAICWRKERSSLSLMLMEAGLPFSESSDTSILGGRFLRFLFAAIWEWKVRS